MRVECHSRPKRVNRWNISGEAPSINVRRPWRSAHGCFTFDPGLGMGVQPLTAFTTQAARSLKRCTDVTAVEIRGATPWRNPFL
jgi:hypothetical protein